MKDNTKPIFIRPNLKGFLEKKKLVLKDKNNKFYGMSETLMYYLEDSELFRNDWLEYVDIDDMTKKIFKFENDDLLSVILKLG